MLDAENPAENPAENVDSSATGPEETTSGGTAATTSGGFDAPPADTKPADAPPADTSADGSDDAGGAPAEAATEAGAEAGIGDGAPVKKAAKKTAAKKATAKKATTKKTAAKRATKKVAEVGEPATEPVVAENAAVPADAAAEPVLDADADADVDAAETAPAEVHTAEGAETAPAAKRPAKKAAKKAPAKRAAKKTAAPKHAETAEGTGPAEPEEKQEEVTEAAPATVSATALLFQPPDPTKAVVTRRRRVTRPEAPAVADGGEGAAPEAGEGEESKKPAKKAAKKSTKAKPKQVAEEAAPEEAEEPAETGEEGGRDEGEEGQGGERRRRRRGGRRRRRSGGGDENGPAEGAEGAADESEQGAQAEEGEESSTGSRRRRRRRRAGEAGEGAGEESENTVTRVRKPRNAEDEITAVTGSTRLEAKKQRRREGREAGRRRAPIVSEAEFLARRESVDRVMVIRQRKDLTQIAVLEDKVLVEHYVSRESQTSLIGNVYLGRVQNVLPSMEAAFIDIGKGRNAVLYAGEVNWDALGAKNGSPRKIEAVLKSGQPILVQVTKDPIGHKGARLTSQVSLPGRFLVYVPDGTTSGISRKLPDTERNRLKTLLKDIVPDSAGVIVRTAAEGASEEELTRDVERLTARWSDIESKAKGGNAPQLLYGEPDLTLKVVRDLFTEDFNKLVIAGDDAWDMVEGYVSHVAPDLADRLERYDDERDVFAAYRIDEQIEKALDRKVWLPSGGSLVIDRTEAMTVVDVNTGKFTGSGGNLEETVTKNNLEAAEEIVRQLRLRDIGGIIVVDFIDMVLESNRDLVLRRLVECLGRDRTRHQVAEVTSLGLVQMTRKRIGTGLLEAFSESCEACQGRGLVLHHEPIEPKRKADEEPRRGRRAGRGRGRDETPSSNGGQGGGVPSPKDIAAIAKHEEKPEEKREGAAATDGEKPEERREPAEGAEREAVASAETAGGEAVETPEVKPAGRGRGGRGRAGRGRGPAAPSEVEPAAATDEVPVGAAAVDRSAPGGEQQEATQSGLFPVAEEQAPAERQVPPAQPADEPAAQPEEQATAEVPGAGTDAVEGAAGPKGVEAAQTEAAPAEPVAPPAPKIVTTVRRRSARRPAGPPSGAAAQASTTGTGSVAVDEPADESGTEEPKDVDPIATLVDAAEETVDGVESDGASADVPATPHVPVKKRGSRRR